MDTTIPALCTGSGTPTPPPSSTSRKGWPSDYVLIGTTLEVCGLPEAPPSTARGWGIRTYRAIQYRTVLARLAHDYTLKSWPEIARLIGNRSHSTVGDLLTKTARCGQPRELDLVADASIRLACLGFTPIRGEHAKTSS